MIATRALFLALPLIFIASTQRSNAQSGKAFFKEGEKLQAQQDLDGALEKYTLAVQVDPKMLKGYTARGEVYRLLGRKEECAADFKRAAELEPGDAALMARAAKAYLDLDQLAEARALSDRALLADRKDLDALRTKVLACLAMKDLDAASAAADQALDVKGTTDTYYLHGIVRAALRDYKTAELDLERVIEWNYLYEDAYVALAGVQLALYDQYSGPTMQMRTLDKAAERCTQALDLNPQSTQALFMRSKVYAHQKEFAKAIDDVSKCVALGRSDNPVYMQRARYYNQYGQHQNAVNDLNRVLLQDPNDLEAMLLRASCREANVELEEALRDIDAAQKLMQAYATPDDEGMKELAARRARIAQQIFEMNRESDPPSITVVEPYRVGDLVQVSSALAQVKVTGHVRDRNPLKNINVNGAPSDFSKDERDPEFFISVPLLSDATEITVQATDVYDNIASVTLRVERTEGTAPVVSLTSPNMADGAISVDADREDVFVEGRATDNSRIRSITVDGMYASFVPDTIDTEFSIKLPIKGKEKFTVRAEDQFGNGGELTVRIARKAPPMVVASTQPKLADKPAVAPSPATGSTGTTWVVFIENSNYRNFPALQAPSGDVAKMQKTFSKYSVQKTITKRNMSKVELERFFNMELRDMVRTNKVNTILVYYAGHGRNTGGKSYWFSNDTEKDDIYTFFNYGSLKAQMQNYSETVSNTLVVSDAAGADPSFYELTR